MKKSVLVLMAAAALAGCSQSDIQTPVDAKQVDIVLKSSHHAIEVESSRAPYIGNISESNPLSARILATTATGNYSTSLHADGNMVFKGVNSVTAYERTGSMTEEQAKFPGAPDDDLFLCGLSPFTGWVLANNMATISLDGKTDVMAAAEQKTTKADTNNGKVSSLIFNHLLTKLEVSIKAETVAAMAYWGKVTDIELVSVKGNDPQNQVKVNLAEGTAKFEDNAGSIGLYGMSGTTDEPIYSNNIYSEQVLSVTGRPVAYSIVAPFVSGTDTDLTFRITTEYVTKGKDVTVKLPYNGDTDGRAFGINLVFKGDSDVILGSATVIDWVFSGNVDVDID